MFHICSFIDGCFTVKDSVGISSGLEYIAT